MNEFHFKFLAGAIIVCYLAAMVAALVRKEKAVYPLFGIGFAINIAMIGAKWWIIDAPPFGTIYHVLAAVPLVFFPVALLIRPKLNHAFMPAVLAFSAAIPLIGTLFMTPPLAWKQMPILQSAWFIPHVMAYCVSYGLCLAAFILMLTALLKRLCKQDDALFTDGVRMLILIAFPLLTFGLCSGAVWGDSAWGGYWGWDPKENWGLITWLCYAIYLHLAILPKHRAVAALIHIIAFLSLLSTLFMVAYTRFGSESKHFYGS